MRGAGRSRNNPALYRGIIPARAGSSRQSSSGGGAARDHPRACGEQRLISVAVLSLSGSSPRVRGAGRARPIAVREDGIIPARAGSRVSILFQNSRHRDHPRACGEQSLVVVDPSTHPGSSPRVRGAVLCRAGSPAGPGIIPARAGSSFVARSMTFATWDHPRACGEQDVYAIANELFEGSSPRVRGAVEAVPNALNSSGIIPARAGSRPSGRGGRVDHGDHPRACGEQLMAARTVPMTAGSSPRVRGAAVHHRHAHGGEGIIPARAGSSPRRSTSGSATWDHPRACGEQYGLDKLVHDKSGSSPRVRGAGKVGERCATCKWIIPARAGSSHACAPSSWTWRDHPRACGEQEGIEVKN